MATPNLAVREVSPAQNNKVITINEAFAALDEATQGSMDIDVASGDVVLTSAIYRRNFFFNFTGAPGVERTITVPNGIDRFFAVRNSTGQQLNFRVGGVAGTTAVAAGSVQLFYSTGVILNAF